MRSNMKVFHASIGHKEAMFHVELLAARRHPIDFTPHKCSVIRMNAMKHQVTGRLDRPVDFKNSIGFFRPDDVAADDPPAKAPGPTESLSLGQIGLVSPEGVFRALSIFYINGRSVLPNDVAGLVA
jgi:hypothetical protein